MIDLRDLQYEVRMGYTATVVGAVVCALAYNTYVSGNEVFMLWFAAVIAALSAIEGIATVILHRQLRRLRKR